MMDLLGGVDLVDGQKTGFYLDQRENRRAAASYVPQDGRVLDVCCYVGGFAISIGKWSSAREIIAIDSSHKRSRRLLGMPR